MLIEKTQNIPFFFKPINFGIFLGIEKKMNVFSLGGKISFYMFK